MPSPSERSEIPDRLCSFSYKTSWLAIRSDDTDAVAGAEAPETELGAVHDCAEPRCRCVITLWGGRSRFFYM